MVARKKPSKLVKIGLSHSERARELASKGLYSEAISELRIALFSLRNENADGSLNGDIAGVLNSIGSASLLLEKYEEAADAFRDAIAIRRPMANSPDLAGSLIGLSDACRGQCDFEQAVDCLDEALHIALARRNDPLASRIVNLLDMLERTRENMPGLTYDGSHELYVPGAFKGVQAVLRHTAIDVAPGKVRLSLLVGFPALTAEILDKAGEGELATCAAVFFNGRSADVKTLTVIDDTDQPVLSALDRYDGILFAPGSYNCHGPLPIPACKTYTYTGGQGALLKWQLAPNGLYRADLELDAPGIEYGFKFLLALPFYVKLGRITIDVRKPLEYGLLRIDEGTFHATRSRERVTIGPGQAYALKRRLFEGSVFGMIDLDAESTLKYAAIAFELSKRA